MKTMLISSMALIFHVLLLIQILLCNCLPTPEPPGGKVNAKTWYYSSIEAVYFLQNSSMANPSRIQGSNDQQNNENFEKNTVSKIAAPHCPNRTLYCDNIPNYPHALLENVLKSGTFNKNLFRNKNSLYNFRDLSESADKTVCGSYREAVRPMVATNKMGMQKFVLNQKSGQDFVQQIYVEKCLEDTEVQDSCGSSTRRNTGCREKYLPWKLLSFSLNGEVIVDTFLFPSSCDCMYV